MRIFFDSSAWVKCYVRETGSDRVTHLCAEATAVAVAIICLPEVISGMNRLRREKRMSSAEYESARRLLLDDMRRLTILDLTASVVAISLRLLESYPLRAMDALHLACAKESHPDLFVSSDRRQVEVAEKMGMAVVVL